MKISNPGRTKIDMSTISADNDRMNTGIPSTLSATNKNTINSNSSISNNSVISLDRAELVEEHNRLVNILKKGSIKERLAEAKHQQIELNEYKAKHHNKEGV